MSAAGAGHPETAASSLVDASDAGEAQRQAVGHRLAGHLPRHHPALAGWGCARGRAAHATPDRADGSSPLEARHSLGAIVLAGVLGDALMSPPIPYAGVDQYQFEKVPDPVQVPTL